MSVTSVDPSVKSSLQKHVVKIINKTRPKSVQNLRGNAATSNSINSISHSKRTSVKPKEPPAKPSLFEFQAYCAERTACKYSFPFNYAVYSDIIIEMVKEMLLSDYDIPIEIITENSDRIFYKLEAIQDKNKVCDILITLLQELKRYPTSFIRLLKMKFTICYRTVLYAQEFEKMV
mmetsp:Transcript_12226/g.10530  ORF Transcript_12226/g.10530 Transcript_12226/m.10530 type:complete len:176 (-) Transcript_12226:720-1247(-)